MKTIILSLLMLSALAASAQHLEVRKLGPNELWHMSLCETSYTRYAGDCAFTYTVDSVYVEYFERGVATIYYITDPLLEKVIVAGRHVYENLGCKMYEVYEINNEGRTASVSSDDRPAKNRPAINMGSAIKAEIL